MSRLSFASDYMEGAHEAILSRLREINYEKMQGYGTDPLSEQAREKIRSACGCPEADVFFLVGGTQTNATVISALLRSYEGVVAAVSGHISTHEAGAIELGGHKVLTLPEHEGKITAADLRELLVRFETDEARDHLVRPGMVYVSQPTESGTLYSLRELREISAVCREYGLPLYLDGARLAYALACPSNDVSLQELAELCDVFYIGGTKCGALFGEAVVIPKRGFIPHFFTIMKQHGALLAKGWLLGLQFDVLFTDGLYLKVGKAAIAAAGRIRATLREYGYQLCWDTPANQVFVILENAQMKRLAESVEFSFWEKYDATHTVIRLAASWATTEEDTEKLLVVLKENVV
ncbi:MAG: aminotransferase class I/II-fold pyridoxal phosphate-dependent enzyme [Oscillospiraceae bacterium]|nr:aminotransferase class I/II-fold pyridoxal phosphate-dependent enzyme [Oscillospiraceae bacterium]